MVPDTTVFHSERDVIQYLGQFTYKPNCQFGAWCQESGFSHYEKCIVLNLVTRVPDVTRKDQKPVAIAFTQAVNLYHLIQGGPVVVQDVVERFFMAWEKHEMQEWMFWKGQRVTNPHEKG